MAQRASPPRSILWHGDADVLVPAARWLQQGGIVAFPTETFYGLAIDPASADAAEALVALKGRGSSAALPLVAASLDQVIERCGALNAASARLAHAYWPGPLSLVLDAPAWIADAVHAGTRTVAVRVPAHPVARALAECFGAPITSTSANFTGQPPASAASALAPIAADARVLVIDAGPTPGGAPSTIVDVRGDRAVCIRAGAIAWNRVLESLEG